MPAEASPDVAMVSQAYRFALGPAPRKTRMMASHAGARRYVSNWANERMSADADARQAQRADGEEPPAATPGLYQLGPEWTLFKNTATGCRRCRRLLARRLDGNWADARTGETSCGDSALAHDATIVACEWCCAILQEAAPGSWLDGTRSARCASGPRAGELHDPGSEFMAWTSEISLGTVQAAIRDVADVAWPRYRSGKAGRPAYKRKGKCRESFQLHGPMLQLRDAAHVVLPKIGAVTVMSDDSLHPAMTRGPGPARSHSPQARRGPEPARPGIATI